MKPLALAEATARLENSNGHDVSELRGALERRLLLVEGVRRSLNAGGTAGSVATAENLLEADVGASVKVVSGGSSVPFEDTADLRRSLARERRVLSELLEVPVAEVEKPAEKPADFVVSNGATGKRVKQLQDRLRQLGYETKKDGKFGPKTQAAVESFQTDHSLEADGTVGHRTRVALRGSSPEDVKALRQQSEAKTPETEGAAETKSDSPNGENETDTGLVSSPSFEWLTKGRGYGDRAPNDNVRRAQEAMTAMGTFVGDGGSDGRFGPATEAAVKRIQRRYGLKADGLVGPRTWGLLQTHGMAPEEPAVEDAEPPAEEKVEEVEEARRGSPALGRAVPAQGPRTRGGKKAKSPEEREFERLHPRVKSRVGGGEFKKKGAGESVVEKAQKIATADRRAAKGKANAYDPAALKKADEEEKARNKAALARKEARKEAKSKAKSSSSSSSSKTGSEASTATGGGISEGLIQSGGSGAKVKKIQRLLHLDPSGKFDSETVKAVRQYQRKHGLLVDGIVGAQTLSSLLGEKAKAPGKITTDLITALANYSPQKSTPTPTPSPKPSPSPKPGGSSSAVAPKPPKPKIRKTTAPKPMTIHQSAMDMEEASAKGVVAKILRLPDGTFAPKGRGRVLSPHESVHISFKGRGERGKVSADTKSIKLTTGPDKGKVVAVNKGAHNKKAVADKARAFDKSKADPYDEAHGLDGMASPGTGKNEGLGSTSGTKAPKPSRSERKKNKKAGEDLKAGLEKGLPNAPTLAETEVSKADLPTTGDGKANDLPGLWVPPDPVDVGDDVEKAAQLLGEGKAVQLSQPRHASTLLDRLTAMVKEAADKGDSAPNFDLCKVSVRGTNLFCAQSKGVERVQMPQLSGNPRKGSPADKLPKNDKGEVDIGPAFREHLLSKGVAITEETVPAANLRASQRELNGPKVAGMVGFMRGGGELPGGPTWTSRDDYIVDGHHRWAAEVARDVEDNQLGDVQMPIQRVDMPITQLLHEANQFAADQGLPQAGAFGGGGEKGRRKEGMASPGSGSAPDDLLERAKAAEKSGDKATAQYLRRYHEKAVEAEKSGDKATGQYWRRKAMESDGGGMASPGTEPPSSAPDWKATWAKAGFSKDEIAAHEKRLESPEMKRLMGQDAAAEQQLEGGMASPAALKAMPDKGLLDHAVSAFSSPDPAAKEAARVELARRFDKPGMASPAQTTFKTGDSVHVSGTNYNMTPGVIVGHKGSNAQVDFAGDIWTWPESQLIPAQQAPSRNVGSGPMFSPGTSPARSPKGNVRNMKAMTNQKLTDLAVQMVGSNDAEAKAAVTAELNRRGAAEGINPQDLLSKAGMASPSAASRQMVRMARTTDKLSREGSVKLPMGTGVTREGDHWRVEHNGRSVNFPGTPGQAVKFADRLDKPPAPITKDLRSAFETFTNPKATKRKRRKAAENLATFAGGRSEQFESVLGQFSPATIPQGYAANDKEVGLEDLPIGSTFALKGGDRYVVVKQPGGAFVISKPIDANGNIMSSDSQGKKIKPLHKKFAPTSLGPPQAEYTGGHVGDKQVDDMAAQFPDEAPEAAAPPAPAPTDTSQIAAAISNAIGSQAAPAGPTPTPSAPTSAPTAAPPPAANSLTAAATQLGEGWSPAAVQAALTKLAAEGIILDPSVESPSTIAAVVRATKAAA